MFRKERVKEEKENGRKETVSKGTGGSKGKWSNLGHTWDNSWYNSNWHGTACGLEVDPWAAVELVLYLRSQFEIEMRGVF